MPQGEVLVDLAGITRRQRADEGLQLEGAYYGNYKSLLLQGTLMAIADMLNKASITSLALDEARFIGTCMCLEK